MYKKQRVIKALSYLAKKSTEEKIKLFNLSMVIKILRPNIIKTLHDLFLTEDKLNGENTKKNYVEKS
jgi:hypothetical protein